MAGSVMTAILLRRALALLTRYADLYSTCKCTDKMERLKLFSDSMNFAEDMERETRSENAPK